MPTRRQQRVADQLREVISEIIRFETEDPGLEGITVMDVVIDRELEVANVYVNCLKGEESQPAVIAALTRATGFLRKQVGRRVRLQNTPELRFHWDDSLREADKIERLLASVEIPPADDETESGNERD